jgi:hypothetical protein
LLYNVTDNEWSCMERSVFLAQPDIAGFIEWLRFRLPTLPLHLRVLKSPYVPNGLDVYVTGLPAVLEHYHWKAGWTSADGTPVKSSDWKTTRTSLRRLSEWIRQALDEDDEDAALKACLAIMRWGGVRGANPFLHRLHEQRRLVAYFKRLAPLMALDQTAAGQLAQLDNTSVERFDAGLTKIHALIDGSGSPILDSRVGAAAAMLYALYRRDANPAVRSVLHVPSGSARGKQIRDPRLLAVEYMHAPRFYTREVPPHEWARSQLRLGWILRAVLDDTDWFMEDGQSSDMAARCHAFEACLFMAGYDLRCFDGIQSDATPLRFDMEEELELTESSTTWVPTGHPFAKVIAMYAAFRRSVGEEGSDAASFQKYLMEKHGHTANTAKGYCFPLGPNEFDLYDIPLSNLDALLTGGEPGLYAALSSSDPYVFSEEREQVCLMDVFITGMTAELTPAQRVATLLEKGYAGTPNAANVLLAVGRGVGSHFGLLDKNGKPTKFFNRFFASGRASLPS